MYVEQCIYFQYLDSRATAVGKHNNRLAFYLSIVTPEIVLSIGARRAHLRLDHLVAEDIAYQPRRRVPARMR